MNQKISSITKDIKKEPQWDRLERYTSNITKSHTPEWVTHRLENNYVIIMSPTSDSPAQGSDIGKRSPQSIWLWRPARLNCRGSTELGKIKTSLSKGAHKIWCALGPRAKSSNFRGASARPTCWFCFLFKHFIYLFLAALGLSCGTWDLLLWHFGSSLQCTGFSLVVARGLQSLWVQ